MNALVLIVMLVGGVPEGAVIRLEATTPDCHTELAVIRGVNASLAERGVVYLASCQTR